MVFDFYWGDCPLLRLVYGKHSSHAALARVNKRSVVKNVQHFNIINLLANCVHNKVHNKLAMQE